MRGHEQAAFLPVSGSFVPSSMGSCLWMQFLFISSTSSSSKIPLGSQLEPLAAFSSHFRDPLSELDWQCPSIQIVTPTFSVILSAMIFL